MKKVLIGIALAASPAVAQVPAADAGSPVRPATYPPCSRIVTDSCMQMTDLKAGEAPPVSQEDWTGVGGPYEPIEDHANAAPDDVAAATSDPFQPPASEPEE